MPTYTRFIIIFALSLLININTIQPTQANDQPRNEFGQPFWNQATSGFTDPLAETENEILATDMDAMAEALQNIQPAAGDESAPETNDVHNTEKETGTITP